VEPEEEVVEVRAAEVDEAAEAQAAEVSLRVEGVGAVEDRSEVVEEASVAEVVVEDLVAEEGSETLRCLQLLMVVNRNYIFSTIVH
jgi:hypothetical protein